VTYLWLTSLAGIFSAQFILARRVPEPLRSILRVQAIYWFLAYVLRPLVLVLASPAPTVNDAIADGRLAHGGYDTNLDRILLPIVVGHVVFLTVALLVGARFASHFRSVDVSPVLVLILFAILIGARLSWFLGARSAIVSTLLGLAPIVLGLMLIPSHPKRRLALFIVVLLATEASWSMIFASKTPISTLLLCLVLTSASRGWRPRLKHIAGVALVIPVFVLGFSALQSNKQDAAVEADLRTVNARYPAILRPVLPIVTRFDLLAAVTDSTYVAGRWISVEEFSYRAAMSTIPRPLNQSKIYTAGENWAIEVRSLSRPSRPGVSLAEGPVAEGNAVAGLPGVMAGCALLALITVAGTRAFATGNVLGYSLGCCLILLPTIQERGLLGVVEVMGKGLQLAILAAALSLLFGGLHRSRDYRIPSGVGLTPDDSTGAAVTTARQLVEPRGKIPMLDRKDSFAYRTGAATRS
jgi:hypothetical protein